MAKIRIKLVNKIAKVDLAVTFEAVDLREFDRLAAVLGYI